ncbi:klaroid [Carabus blaptoides fortunei]
MDADNTREQLETDQEIQQDEKLAERKSNQTKIIMYTSIIIAVVGIAYYFLVLQEGTQLTENDTSKLETVIENYRSSTKDKYDYESVKPPKLYNPTVQMYNTDVLLFQDFELRHSDCTKIHYGFHVFPLHTIYARPEWMFPPTRCFAFLGNWGRLRIKLRQKLHISAVTVELKRRAFMGPRNKRVPETFVIYGYQNSNNDTLTKLGIFSYMNNGPSRQTFFIPDQNQITAHEFVELRMLSNYGFQVFICVYRFRVPGDSC